MFKRSKVKVSILGYREGMILVEDLRGKVRIFSSLGGLMQVRSALCPSCLWVAGCEWFGAVIGEIFGHNLLTSQCLRVQSVTCSHPPVFLHQIGLYFVDSFEMVGKFPAILTFNRLFLKLNQFICNSLPVLK
jgi:hypothetical protein